VNIAIHETPDDANAAATERLAEWLTDGRTRNVMPAAGNTPLELYRRIGEKRLDLRHLTIFVLDEYVGVPKDEPRNCSNLLRESVQEAWGIPEDQFFMISPDPEEALASVQQHEQRIKGAGGLDVVILGLGQNGHLGFNEPGSVEDSEARVVDLQKISVEANRLWFDGKYAPDQGVTVGLKTILAAKRIMVLAYGAHKVNAVATMVQGPRAISCPASFLQGHAHVELFLEERAAAKLAK
jgi:glucosamine-6-phosphate deaminase